MDHSAGTFVFDPQGRLRLYVGYGQGPDVFTHDIARTAAHVGLRARRKFRRTARGTTFARRASAASPRYGPERWISSRM